MNSSHLPSGLRFFGRIMASVSHELNNVITVVEEVAGLLDDLSELARRGKPLTPERLSVQTEKIHRQVARGKALIKHMNRLAHDTDEARREENIGEELENIAALCRRFAERKRTSIDVSVCDPSPTSAIDPFLLKQAVFSCIMTYLSTESEGPSIELRTECVPQGISLRLSGAALSDTDVKTLEADLSPLLDDLHATLSFSMEQARTTVLLLLHGADSPTPTPDGAKQ